MTDPLPALEADWNEPPVEVDSAFAVDEPAAPIRGPVCHPTPEVVRSSLTVLAVALHVAAVIIIAAVLYWKLA